MNEQNINNGMNGGPGMPPPPPQGYMNMNGGPGMLLDEILDGELVGAVVYHIVAKH